MLLIGISATLFTLKLADRHHSDSMKSQDENSINYAPPTVEEKAAANTQKEQIIKEDTQAPRPSAPGTRLTVKPIIVSTSGNTLRAFVADITESTGTCTAKFSNNAKTITKASPAFADAQSTICTPINFQDGDIGIGWNVTVTYQSTTSEGSSDATIIH